MGCNDQTQSLIELFGTELQDEHKEKFIKAMTDLVVELDKQKKEPKDGTK